VSRKVFFWSLLKSSLLNRKSRVLVTILSVVLGISLASTLLNISFDVRERLGGTLRGYGANILLVPKDATLQVGLGGLSFGSLLGEGFIKESELTKIEGLSSAGNLLGYTPYLYAVVDLSNQSVVLAGVWFDSLMKVNPTLELKGSGIQNRNDVNSIIIGANGADRLGINLEDRLEITYKGRNYWLIVVGILSTGGSEDNQVLVSLSLAQVITQKNGLIHTVQLSYVGGGLELKAVAEELSKAIPSAEVKVMSQVAEAEETFLGKIQAVMAALTAGVLTASAFAVMSTMSTTVLERRNEIGLMLALGASPGRIAQLFFAEALVIGFAGGLMGYFIGVGLATALWLKIFNTTILPRPIVFPAVVAIALGVALMASLLPVRQALRVKPAVILKGE